jgi:2'-5' RNA ligase
MNKNRYVKFNLSVDIQKEYANIAKQIESLIISEGFEYSPMDLEQIHMTVCYLGNLQQNLNKIKSNTKNKLVELDEKLNKLPPIDSIEFDRFEIFGSKQNLIIAKFKISDSDKKKIIEFKKDMTENFFAPDENFYIPHITLGKVNWFSKNKSPKELNFINEIFIPINKKLTNLKCMLN